MCDERSQEQDPSSSDNFIRAYNIPPEVSDALTKQLAGIGHHPGTVDEYEVVGPDGTLLTLKITDVTPGLLAAIIDRLSEDHVVIPLDVTE